MFAGYAQTLPMRAALAETFDARKPCELCVSVAKAKELGQKQAPPTVERTAEKILLACETPPRAVFAVPLDGWPDAPARVALTRTDAVPVPPPRA